MKEEACSDDFFQECSFSALLGMYRATKHDTDRFTTTQHVEEMIADGFLTRADLDIYMTKTLLPRHTLIEKRLRKIAIATFDGLNQLAELEQTRKFDLQDIDTTDIEILIQQMKKLDLVDKLNTQCNIKDELQSYNILKNDKYKRFRMLKGVLDSKKKSGLQRKDNTIQMT